MGIWGAGVNGFRLRLGGGGFPTGTTGGAAYYNGSAGAISSDVLIDQSSIPLQIVPGSLPTQQNMTYNAGHAPTGTAGTAVIAPDTSGNLDVNENNTGYARICTATNGICSTSGSSPPAAAWTLNTGIAASPAAALFISPSTGTVSHCYFTTTNSDGFTNLVFNVKLAGTNIISGTSATIAAGTSLGTVSTFSLTSGTISVTAGNTWELDVTAGTANWVGVVQCY